MLDDIYMRILDMTKIGSVVILAVLLARLLLKKAPKVFSYALWAVVLLRLLCPAALEAPVSMVPEVTPVAQNYSLNDEPISILGAGTAAYHAVGDALNGGPGIQRIYTTEQEPDGTTRIVTTDWGDVWILFGQYVWFAGVAGMLLYGAVSYGKLRRKLAVTIPLGENIFIADDIQSPFVVGLVHPKIYLPCSLNQKEQAYIILHEQHHISRYDHIIKALAFLALCLHWFNPLVWVAFILASRDMEMSCDEAVIRKLGEAVRADYSASLLTLATGRRIIAGTPLAFGEGDPKGRIRNLANWKKPGFWVILIAAVLCVLLAVCLLTDPLSDDNHEAGETCYYGTVVDFAMSVVNEGDRKGHAYITLECDDGTEELFWLADGYDPPENVLGQHVMVRGRIEDETGLFIASRVTITGGISSGTLEDAINDAILDCNWSQRDDSYLQCASFVELARDENGDVVTVYGLALHQVYTVADGALAEKGGSHIPVALTFALTDSGEYILTEYWQPSDGSYYDDDIKAKFPAFVWPDTQTYILSQVQNCYVQAADYFGLDTDEIVSSLLEKICESGRDYDTTESIRLHYAMEYRELLYYGRYTLKYCFSEFFRGGQTDSRGRVMSLVCREIMHEWGEGFSTTNPDPQVWFEGFRQHAQLARERNSDEVLQEKYPASWILLRMTGDVPALPDWGITLAAENVTSNGATIVCTQSGGHPTGDLFSGSYFVVQHYRDGQWVTMEPLRDDLAWTMEAWGITMNGTVEWGENWSYVYGTLPAGRYRIGKSIMDFRAAGDFDEAMYYAEFTIE